MNTNTNTNTLAHGILDTHEKPSIARARRSRSVLAAAALAIAAGLSLASCAPQAGARGTEAEKIELHDVWAKAALQADGMTGIFAEAVNASDSLVTVTGVESTVAGVAELHEIVIDDRGASVMREKQDGFEIPANGTRTFAPGGDHLMLMQLERDLKPGESVAFTLRFADGSSSDHVAIVKEYAGANENYGDHDHDGDHDHGHDGDHDHGGEDH
ncbi:copper chaperone PCu(A)C [Ruicaihuangia caeni]|uniref:copper chaperone PCu(A)C n=1 Tax=Ruicaihuangia caeni TaxID=3042517 RepID=UPI00338D6E9B